MSWVENILKGLFSEAKQNAVQWKEKLDLSHNKAEIDLRKNDLKAFLLDLACANNLDSLLPYQLIKLSIPQSEGRVLKTNSLEEAQWLELAFSFFISQLIKTDLYFVALQEKRINEDLQIHKEESFVYLKPKLAYIEEKHDQKYGQISVSIIHEISKDEQIYSLKIQANYYSGFNYTLPKPLHDLFEVILKN